MGEIIKILCVEDNKGDALLIEKALIKSKIIFNFVNARNFEQALDYLHNREFDFMFLDLALPDAHGLDLIKSLEKYYKNIPTVILTGFADYDLIQEAIEYGIQDYLVKGDISGSILEKTVLYSIERCKTKHELKSKINKLQDMQEKLTQSEQLYKSLFNGISIGIMLVDHDFNVIKNNIHFKNLLGPEKADLTGKKCFREIMGQNHVCEFCPGKNALKMNSPASTECKVKIGGKEHWLKMHAFPVLGQNNQAQFIELVEDITQQKILQQEIVKNQELYRILLNNFPRGAVVLFDRDLRYTFVDGQIYHDLKSSLLLSSKEIIGKTIWEVLPDEISSILVPKYIRALNGEEFDFELELANDIYNVNVVPVKDDNGDIQYGMLIAQNITDRKNIQKELSNKHLELTMAYEKLEMLNEELEATNEELEQSNEELEQTNYKIISTINELEQSNRIIRRMNEKLKKEIFNRNKLEKKLVWMGNIAGQIKEGVCVTDLNGDIIYANNAWAEMHFYDEAIIPGMNINKFLKMENEKSFFNEVQEKLNLNGKLSLEISMRRKDSSMYYATLSFSLFRNDNGNDVGMIISVNDISGLKKNEKELKNAKAQAELANKAKSEFLANMSHELRTPLNALINFSKALKDGVLGELNGEQKDISARLVYNSNHLLTLINDLLDIEQIEVGRRDVYLSDFELNDLKETIESSAEPYIENEVHIFINIENEKVYSDEKIIRQILVNLVSNAAKFTPNGYITVNLKLTGAFIFLCVEDTGMGISQSNQKKIFDKYFQTYTKKVKHRGTGLGLPLVKELATLLKGEIEIESIEGKGTKVTCKVRNFKEKTKDKCNGKELQKKALF